MRLRRWPSRMTIPSFGVSRECLGLSMEEAEGTFPARARGLEAVAPLTNCLSQYGSHRRHLFRRGAANVGPHRDAGGQIESRCDQSISDAIGRQASGPQRVADVAHGRLG